MSGPAPEIPPEVRQRILREGLADWRARGLIDVVGYSWGAYWLYLGRPFHFIALGAGLLAVAGIHAWRGARAFAAAWALVGLLLVYLSTLILSIFDLQRSFRVDTASAPPVVWLLLYAPYAAAVIALAIMHFGWRRAALTDPPVLVVLFLMIVMIVGSLTATTPDAREVWFILLLTLLTSAGVYLGIAWASPVFLNTARSNGARRWSPSGC